MLMACMYTGVKANLPKKGDQSQVVPSSLKIGYVDVAYIFGQLPEAIKNSQELQTFQQQLDNQIRIKIQELEEKGKAYQEQINTLTEAQKNQKIKECQYLHANINNLNDEKHTKIVEKHKAIIQPLYTKMQEVIHKIAEEQNYTIVLAKDTEAGPIVLFAETAFDLSELVLEKLKTMAPKKIEPPVVGPKTQTAAQPSTRSAKAVKKK
ncbi:OmpH family outer membrane protein [Candidatus Cardinium hertigii]|uniref:OmpH family outer membrane protein n=1 Tax=Candidatus Cardinium hertigii TaxID=247481 RepID=UPI003D7D25FD